AEGSAGPADARRGAGPDRLRRLPRRPQPRAVPRRAPAPRTLTGRKCARGSLPRARRRAAMIAGAENRREKKKSGVPVAKMTAATCVSAIVPIHCLHCHPATPLPVGRDPGKAIMEELADLPGRSLPDFKTRPVPTTPLPGPLEADDQ